MIAALARFWRVWSGHSCPLPLILAFNIEFRRHFNTKVKSDGQSLP